MAALFVSGLIAACGSSGGNGGSGSEATTRETVTLSGSVADSMAGSHINDTRSMFARLSAVLTITQSAVAQQQQVLEGIFVEAFEGDVKIGEDVTDPAGEFLIENVPCATPITLVFTFEGNTVTLSGISVPCPETGDTGVISMVVSLDFQAQQGQVDQIDDEDDLQNAAISCAGDEDITLGSPDEDFIVDGGGFACIATAGNCELEILAPAVILENCSTCIDSRGDSSVEAETRLFECFSNGDGIRTVGNSDVDITIIGSQSEFLISAGEDGIDSRGNSEVDLDGDSDDTDDSNSLVTIEGFTSGITAVGNSEVEVDAGICDITPDVVEVGNAEVEIYCEEGNVEDDGQDDGPGDNGPPDDIPGNGPPDEE